MVLVMVRAVGIDLVSAAGIETTMTAILVMSHLEKSVVMVNVIAVMVVTPTETVANEAGALIAPPPIAIEGEEETADNMTQEDTMHAADRAVASICSSILAVTIKTTPEQATKQHGKLCLVVATAVVLDRPVQAHL